MRQAALRTTTGLCLSYNAQNSDVRAYRSAGSPTPFQIAELEILANRILEHLILLEDNRILSQKVHALTEKFSTIDSRLERIDSMVGRMGAILLESPRR